MEYLIVDRGFNILEKSIDVQRFADCPDEVILGNDVRLGFPELVGLEEILIEILEGRETSFDLEGLARCSDNTSPLYIDIHISRKQSSEYREAQLIFLLKEVTDKIALEQKLVQASNETSLLLSSLRTAHHYIDKIISSLPSALLVTNKAGKIKTVNQAAKELFGYSEEELINSPITKLIADNTILGKVRQQHLGFENSLNNVEITCKTKSGEKIFVAFSCSIVQTDIEESQDFIYIGQNITENKRAQQRQAAQYATTRILSESATLKQATPKLLQAICDSLGWDLGEIWIAEGSKEWGTRGPLWGLGAMGSGKWGQTGFQNSPSSPNPQTSILTLQLRCLETWTKPSVDISEFVRVTQQATFAPGVELPGRVWASCSPHWITDVVSDADFVRSASAALAGLHAAFGFPIQGDTEILGVMTFYSREVQPPDEDLLQMMMAIGSQIGQFIQRKQAEEKLKASEERYRDLFENANDLIQSITLDNRFLYVNRAWRETLGYTSEEISQMTVLDVIHHDSKPQCLDVFQRVKSGETIAQFETEFITKDGKIISLEGSLNCRVVDGKPIAVRGIFRDVTARKLAEVALRHQQKQTERLLLNILPSPIADRLKQRIGTIADEFAEVTVLFADIVGFTELSARSSPTELVRLLNMIFSEFDQLAEQHSLEKIKTIGDAYMIVGGLPVSKSNHAQLIAEMALDMQSAIADFRNKTGKELNIRVGINTGPVVAGVIGIKKFSYDLWGDTVNTASRMESHGLAGKIQVTAATYERLQEQYLFQKRGAIQVKGKGEMVTYFLIGRKNSPVLRDFQMNNCPML